jgi:hypothetical protein
MEFVVFLPTIHPIGFPPEMMVHRLTPPINCVSQWLQLFIRCGGEKRSWEGMDGTPWTSPRGRDADQNTKRVECGWGFMCRCLAMDGGSMGFVHGVTGLSLFEQARDRAVPIDHAKPLAGPLVAPRGVPPYGLRLEEESP